jgi:hypothetical protein
VPRPSAGRGADDLLEGATERGLGFVADLLGNAGEVRLVTSTHDDRVRDAYGTEKYAQPAASKDKYDLDTSSG